MPVSTHNIREFWGQNFYRHSANLILFVTFYVFLKWRFTFLKSCFLKSEKHKIYCTYSRTLVGIRISCRGSSPRRRLLRSRPTNYVSCMHAPCGGFALWTRMLLRKLCNESCPSSGLSCSPRWHDQDGHYLLRSVWSQQCWRFIKFSIEIRRQTLHNIDCIL